MRPAQARGSEPFLCSVTCLGNSFIPGLILPSWPIARLLLHGLWKWLIPESIPLGYGIHE